MRMYEKSGRVFQRQKEREVCLNDCLAESGDERRTCFLRAAAGWEGELDGCFPFVRIGEDS
jgi:hypothetical protein